MGNYSYIDMSIQGFILDVLNAYRVDRINLTTVELIQCFFNFLQFLSLGGCQLFVLCFAPASFDPSDLEGSGGVGKSSEAG